MHWRRLSLPIRAWPHENLLTVWATPHGDLKLWRHSRLTGHTFTKTSENDGTKTHSDFKIWVLTSANVKTNICTCKSNSLKGTLASLPHQWEQTDQAKIILHTQTTLNIAFPHHQGISRLPWNQTAQIPPFPRVFPKCLGKYSSHYNIQFSLYNDP